MSYSWNFILRKTGQSEWTIFVEENGRQLIVFTNCSSSLDAMDRASAFTSSWTSTTLRMEDESGSQTDRVSKQTTES
jgi:hypothetical protein